ncbi:restriction endonuclease subunit S [Achromobacter xylosoxidans]
MHQSYLAQITQFDSFKFHLLGSKTETAVPHVSPRDLREFAFLAPIETTEQRSIAEVLQVWDVAIATTEKLLINSRTKKRNLMQGLLKSHRSFGRKRVPWSRIDFNRVFERIARKNTNQNTNVLTISGQHGLISQRDFFNKSVASKNLQGYTLLETGDFAYNKSYSNGYPMGAIKPLLNYDSGVVSSLYICFRIRPDIEGDIDFYRHYFEAGMLNDEINGIAQEGARNHGLLNVGVKDFFKLKLHVPPIQEQRRIAEVLNVAEAEERCIVRELDKLKEEKRVLMNDLLTGKRRVKMSDALSSSTV